MKNMYGINGIQVKIIKVTHDKTNELNNFLSEYDGNIIDIQSVGELYGVCKFVIVYRAIE